MENLLSSSLSRATRRREVKKEISKSLQDYLIKRNSTHPIRRTTPEETSSFLPSDLSRFSSAPVDTPQSLSFSSSYTTHLSSDSSTSFCTSSSPSLFSTSLASSSLSSCCLPAYIRTKRDLHATIRTSPTSLSLQGLSSGALASSSPFVSLSFFSPFLHLSFSPSAEIDLRSSHSLSPRSSLAFFFSSPLSHSPFSTLSSSRSRHSEEEAEGRRQDGVGERKKKKERIEDEERHFCLSSQTENAGGVTHERRRREEEEEPSIPLNLDRRCKEGREDNEGEEEEEKKKRENGPCSGDREAVRQEEEYFEKKLLYWIDRVRKDQDTGSVYMLKQIVEEERALPSHLRGQDRQEKGDIPLSSSSSLSLGEGEKQEEEKKKDQEEEEEKKKKEIVQEIEKLILHRSQLSSQIG
ncbi:hypothetical protein CSUI_004085, partial [Cystoisospora suis]